jgi:hypothetical protein
MKIVCPQRLNRPRHRFQSYRFHAAVPPSTADTVEIELRCEGWVPQKLITGSKDPRTLGIQGFKITMQAKGAGAKIFDANSGQWRSGP